jgi:hypothetical protein
LAFILYAIIIYTYNNDIDWLVGSG